MDMQPLHAFAEKGTESCAAEWQLKCLLWYLLTHTHTQAAGRSLFSQGHLSVLEIKLLLKVAISWSHGVPVISVPRPLWVTCGIPMSAGWCFPDERAESASAAGEEWTHIFTDLWGFGVGAPAAFPSQWTSAGDLMKPKSCLATVTCFPLNSQHVPPVNKLPRVAGIHHCRGILRLWLGPSLAQQPPIAFWVLFIYSLPSSWAGSWQDSWGNNTGLTDSAIGEN